MKSTKVPQMMDGTRERKSCQRCSRTHPSRGGGGDGEWVGVVGKARGPEWKEEDGMHLEVEVREVGGL